MPKLYLDPGLSQRVHQALTRRLESFMANTSMPSEVPPTENPAVPGHQASMESGSAAGSEQGDQAMPHQEEGSKSPMDRPGEEEDQSRSPRLRVPEPDPNNPAEILAS